MKKQVKLTKTDAILKHLMRYGSITDPVARDKYHTNRLSGFICKLRKREHNIKTVMCEGKDQFGKYTFAKYVYIK